MKYGYVFYDWNLFSIVELQQVRPMTSDYTYSDKFGTFTYNKDNYMWAVSNTPIFHDECEGPFPIGYIFDTKSAAEKFGLNGGI